MKLRDSLEISWDKISDMKISNNSQLVAGSCMSNFVSIYEIDLDSYLTAPPSEEADVPSLPSGKHKAASSQSQPPPPQLQPQPSRRVQTQSSSGYEQSKAPAASAKERPVSPKEAKSPVAQARRSNSLSSLQASEAVVDNEPPPAQSTPAVIWDSDRCTYVLHMSWLSSLSRSSSTTYCSSATDMATSMGESFWKRFKESQRQLELDRLHLHPHPEKEDGKEHDREGDAKDRPGIAERPSSSASQAEGQGPLQLSEKLKSIEDILPPSSFDPVAAGKRGGSAAGALPIVPAAARKPAVPAFRRESKSSDSGNGNGVYRTVDPAAANSQLHSDDVLHVVGMRHGAAANSGSRLESIDDHFLLGNGPQPQGRAVGSRQQPRERGTTTAAAGGGGGGASSDSQSEYKRCDECLSILISKSAPLTSLLSQRLASLRILKQLWTRCSVKRSLLFPFFTPFLSPSYSVNRGEMLDAIDHLTIHSDSLQHNPQHLVLLADFFEAVELKGFTPILIFSPLARASPLLQGMA